jgi:hypothetical protein
MNSKNSTERRMWRYSLFLHGLIFTVFWATAFYQSTIYVPFPGSAGSLPAIILLWMPILIFHVAAYFHYTGRPDMSEIERKAYRVGFADGMRDRNKMPDAYPVSRLGVDDEGELLDDRPDAEKRKREYR